MATTKKKEHRKRKRSSSSSYDISDDILNSFISSNSLLSSSLSSFDINEYNLSKKHKIQLYKISPTIFIYYDKNLSISVLQSEDKQIYYFDDNVNFYNRLKKKLKYTLLDIIKKKEDGTVTVAVNINDNIDIEKFMSYDNLKKIRSNVEIYYYDENNQPITPNVSEKPMYYYRKDIKYFYYNFNKRQLYYETYLFSDKVIVIKEALSSLKFVPKDIKFILYTEFIQKYDAISRYFTPPINSTNPYNDNRILVSLNNDRNQYVYFTDNTQTKQFIPDNDNKVVYMTGENININFYNYRLQKLNYMLLYLDNGQNYAFIPTKDQTNVSPKSGTIRVTANILPNHVEDDVSPLDYEILDPLRQDPNSQNKYRTIDYVDEKQQPYTQIQFVTWQYNTIYYDSINRIFTPSQKYKISLTNGNYTNFFNSDKLILNSYYTVEKNNRDRIATVFENQRGVGSKKLKVWLYETEYFETYNKKITPTVDKIIVYYNNDELDLILYNINQQIITIHTYEFDKIYKIIFNASPQTNYITWKYTTTYYNTNNGEFIPLDNYIIKFADKKNSNIYNVNGENLTNYYTVKRNDLRNTAKVTEKKQEGAGSNNLKMWLYKTEYFETDNNSIIPTTDKTIVYYNDDESNIKLYNSNKQIIRYYKLEFNKICKIIFNELTSEKQLYYKWSFQTTYYNSDGTTVFKPTDNEIIKYYNMYDDVYVTYNSKYQQLNYFLYAADPSYTTYSAVKIAPNIIIDDRPSSVVIPQDVNATIIYRNWTGPIIYFDENNKKFTPDDTDSIKYIDQSNNLYNNNKKKLNYEIKSTDHNTTGKLVVKKKSTQLLNSLAVPSNYSLKRVNYNIIYYDENLHEFTPNTDELIHFSNSTDLLFFNFERKQLKYTLLKFMDSSNTAKVQKNFDTPYLQFYNSVALSSLKQWSYKTKYVNKSGNTITPNSDEIIKFTNSEETKFYNNSKIELNYKISDNKSGGKIATKIVTLRNVPYNIRYLNKNNKEFTPVSDDVIYFIDDDDDENFYNINRQVLVIYVRKSFNTNTNTLTVKIQKSSSNYVNIDTQNKIPLDASQHSSQHASQHSSQRASQHGSPNGSQYVSPNGSQHGSQHVSPNGSQYVSQHGSQHGSPNGSQYVSPNGSQHVSPDGSQHVSQHGSQHVSPNGSQHVSPDGSQHVSPNPVSDGSQHVSPNPVSDGSQHVSPNPLSRKRQRRASNTNSKEPIVYSGKKVPNYPHPRKDYIFSISPRFFPDKQITSEMKKRIVVNIDYQLRDWIFKTIYINEDDVQFLPIIEDTIYFYDDDGNVYNYNKEQILKYNIFKSKQYKGYYIAERKIQSTSSRKEDYLDDTTRSSSKEVTDNEEDIIVQSSLVDSKIVKLCKRWKKNKKINPLNPINPFTTRNVTANGKVYKKLDKICEKIKLDDDIIVSSSSYDKDVDEKTIKTCKKWAAIKQKRPFAPYNPNSKTKRIIRRDGYTYKKLDKMCEKVKIDPDQDVSLSSSPIMYDVDSKTKEKCNKWAAIKRKYPNAPYNPDNIKKTVIAVNGELYNKLNKECHKVPIDLDYILKENDIIHQRINEQTKKTAIKEERDEQERDEQERKERKERKRKEQERIEKKRKEQEEQEERDEQERKERKKQEDDKIALIEKCNLLKKLEKKLIEKPDDERLLQKIAKYKSTIKELKEKCSKIYKKDTDKIILNKQLCLAWKEQRLINPLTNEFIDREGKIYKDIKEQCKKIMQKI
jgi:hypothetical protein